MHLDSARSVGRPAVGTSWTSYRLSFNPLVDDESDICCLVIRPAWRGS